MSTNTTNLKKESKIMKENKIIWSNIDLDFDDWKEDLKEEYPNYNEDKLISLMYDINYEYLCDERINLDIQLSQPIIVIGDLGLWYGRTMGYTMIKSGNIKDCLYSDCDYSEWYVDRLGDLRCKSAHHDGTNYYLYRVFKPDVSETQIENFQEKLYYGTATRKDITRLTLRLGDAIGKVYGWEFPNRSKSKSIN